MWTFLARVLWTAILSIPFHFHSFHSFLHSMLFIPFNLSLKTLSLPSSVSLLRSPARWTRWASLAVGCLDWVSWKQRPLRPQNLKTKTPPYFSELRNYDQPVANATESWALATRILRLLLASWTDIIRGIFFVLNWKILCFVSSKELTPCLFEVFNFHRK